MNSFCMKCHTKGVVNQCGAPARQIIQEVFHMSRNNYDMDNNQNKMQNNSQNNSNNSSRNSQNNSNNSSRNSQNNSNNSSRNSQDCKDRY